MKVEGLTQLSPQYARLHQRADALLTEVAATEVKWTDDAEMVEWAAASLRKTATQCIARHPFRTGPPADAMLNTPPSVPQRESYPAIPISPPPGTHGPTPGTPRILSEPFVFHCFHMVFHWFSIGFARCSIGFARVFHWFC